LQVQYHDSMPSTVSELGKYLQYTLYLIELECLDLIIE
jgi:hypothetical protein